MPLLRHDTAVGAIMLNVAPHAITDSQIELLKTFAEQAVIAIASADTYIALEERTQALAQRNTEYSERIGHQAATIDVLKAMSASPGDPQPVFDLIAERARDLCGAYGVTVFEFDGHLIHWRAATGVSDDPKVRQAVEALFPMPATINIASGRAILNKQIVRVDDLESEPGINPIFRGITAKSLVIVPLMRGGSAIGALSTGSRERGGFSESQIELLKTFAEQTVIAITSAETYRALQDRTEELAQRQDELRVTFENMGDGVAMFDETPRLVAWNRKFQQLLDVPDGVLAERLTYENYIRYLADRGEDGPDVNPEILSFGVSGTAWASSMHSNASDPTGACSKSKITLLRVADLS